MFYLKTPRGDICLEKLTELPTKRTEYLSILQDYDENTVEEFHEKLQGYGHLTDAIWEGHINDRVSHFVLKLAIVHRRSDRLRRAFVRLESLLFNYRLGFFSCLNHNTSNIFKIKLLVSYTCTTQLPVDNIPNL